jgi:predicted MFS family arabinose efflux permease
MARDLAPVALFALGFAVAIGTLSSGDPCDRNPVVILFGALCSALLFGAAAFMLSERVSSQVWIRWVVGVATIVISAFVLFYVALVDMFEPCTD